MSRPLISSCGETRRFVTISSVVESGGIAIKAPCPRASAVFDPSDGVRQPPGICNSNPVPNAVSLPKKLLYVTQRAEKIHFESFSEGPLPARGGSRPPAPSADGPVCAQRNAEVPCSRARFDAGDWLLPVACRAAWEAISDRGRAGPRASRDGPRTDAERRSGPRGAKASGRPPRKDRRACRRGSGTRARRGGHGAGATVP